MAAITLTATGSNTVTAATIAAGAHRDFHVYNPSEHTLILNILGGATGVTDGVPNNSRVSWVSTEENEIPGTRNSARGLIVGPGEFRDVAIVNSHTATQTVAITAESAHNAGTYVGDVVYVGTLNTVRTAGVN